MSETSIDNFDATIRRQALEQAAAETFPPAQPIVNVHAHTFFSYNYRGYSPSHFALESKRQALAVSGIVEFDCLDGLDEFLAAGRLLAPWGFVETRHQLGLWVPERQPQGPARQLADWLGHALRQADA